MSETQVPYGENPSDTATLLLAAAESQGLAPDVVRTTSRNYFVVPASVAEEAGLPTGKPEEEPEEPQQPPGEPDSADYDPADYNVEEVKAYVEEDPVNRAGDVMVKERDGKARSTLLPWLENATSDPESVQPDTEPRSDS